MAPLADLPRTSVERLSVLRYGKHNGVRGMRPEGKPPERLYSKPDME